MKYIPVCLILIGVGALLLGQPEEVTQVIAPVVSPVIVPLTPNELLVQEGKRIGVLSLNGQCNAILQKAAEDHAAYQARVGTQGHQNWENRWRDLRARMPDCRDIYEVANESWNGQSADDAAREMYHSWRQSAGHWEAVNGECRYWGYAMVLGSNGTWYAAGIFAK